MEDAPVISLNGFSPYPGVEPELWERFQKWSYEVYAPIMMKYPGRTGIFHYSIARESPLFPALVSMHHYDSYSSQKQTYSNQDQIAIQNDNRAWGNRNVMDGVYSLVYQLIRGFRSNSDAQNAKPDTRIENAPIMHLEGYRMSLETQEQYNKWFVNYGMNIFIPLFLKQTGVRGYDYYKFLGRRQGGSNPRELDYPAYLSILYFENLEDFARYEKSPELITFHRTLRNTFPGGFDYFWYVQYQLVSSQRRS